MSVPASTLDSRSSSRASSRRNSNSSNANLDPNVHAAITNYCALQRDQIVLDEHCKQGEIKFRDAEQTYKSLLQSYLVESQHTCVPVKIPTNPDDQKETKEMYMRIKEYTTKKAVTDKTIEQVLSRPLRVQDLDAIFDDMKELDATLTDVYSEWVYRQMSDLNTTKSQYFELSDSKEREAKSKGKKRKRDAAEEKEEAIRIPDDIKDLAVQLYRTQYDRGRMRTKKKQKTTKINAEKKRYEPTLSTFLQRKPVGHQSQKVVMKINNQERPYFLKRKVSVRKGSLTLPKAKPLVKQSVTDALAQLDSRLPNKKYSHAEAKILVSSGFKNGIFTTLKHNLLEYQEGNKKQQEKVTLDMGRVAKPDGDNRDGDPDPDGDPDDDPADYFD